MGVDHVDALAPQRRRQPPHGPPVDARPLPQRVDREPVGVQPRAQDARLVEAEEDEPEPARQPPRDPRRQDLGAAHAQGQQHLADRHSGVGHGTPSSRGLLRWPMTRAGTPTAMA